MIKSSWIFPTYLFIHLLCNFNVIWLGQRFFIWLKFPTKNILFHHFLAREIIGIFCILWKKLKLNHSVLKDTKNQHKIIRLSTKSTASYKFSINQHPPPWNLLFFIYVNIIKLFRLENIFYCIAIDIFSIAINIMLMSRHFPLIDIQ